MNNSETASLEFYVTGKNRNLFEWDAVVSLIRNSGIYRHFTLRDQLREQFLIKNEDTSWDSLKAAHWEVFYFLLDNRMAEKTVALTDIPIGTGLSTSTSRRILRKLETLGLVVTTQDPADNRRYITEIAHEYQQVFNGFIADYMDDFAGLIQRHDRQERRKALEELDRTREELAESEAQLLQAQRLASLGHWIWDDVNQSYISVSEENARIHGMSVKQFTKREVIAYYDDQYVHPEDKDHYRSVIFKADNLKIGYEVQYRIIRTDGAIRHIREIGEPILDPFGNLYRSIGTTQDITADVERETVLKEKEAHLNHAQDMALLGYWVWDEKNQRYTDVSESNAKIYGLTVKDFLARLESGYFTCGLIHPDDLDRVRSVITQSDRNGVGYDIIYRIIRKDGAVRVIHEKTEAVLDKDGSLAKSIGTTQDITDIPSISATASRYA